VAARESRLPALSLVRSRLTASAGLSLLRQDLRPAKMLDWFLVSSCKISSQSRPGSVLLEKEVGPLALCFSGAHTANCCIPRPRSRCSCTLFVGLVDSKQEKHMAIPSQAPYVHCLAFSKCGVRGLSASYPLVRSAMKAAAPTYRASSAQCPSLLRICRINKLVAVELSLQQVLLLWILSFFFSPPPQWAL
jgi:hypothetical protein